MSACTRLEASATAEPMRGHMAYLGSPSLRQSAPVPAPGHSTYLGSPRDRSVSNPGVVDLLRRERLRQALYEGCDRAPEFGPQHRDLVSNELAMRQKEN